MPKGKKVCPKCGTEVGPRAFVCPGPGCDHVYKIGGGKNPGKAVKKTRRLVKNGYKRLVPIDWKKLEKGDIIKVFAGSGPYWLNPDTGEKVSMGEHGKFRVDRIEENGILASSLKGYGIRYINMKAIGLSKSCDVIYNEPHKIKLVKDLRNAE